MEQMIVRPETTLVRPFVVCAILRGVHFDPERFNSFMDLQDKLHQNLCRQRTLVAIGTHDMSTIQVCLCPSRLGTLWAGAMSSSKRGLGRVGEHLLMWL